MRIALVACVAGCAVAEVPPVERADVTHLLYLNDCRPNGCHVYPGEDDARTDHSSMIDYPVYLEPFARGDDVWDRFVSCVREMYAPFDLQITTEDPWQEPHFELMIAGSPDVIGVKTAGGAAPFTCPNNVHDNKIGFVFASYVASPDVLCWAAAQESGHMFGLDHTLDPIDAMTWLAPPDRKAGFVDLEADCGERTVRPCNCLRERQNSYELMMTTLGPRQIIL